LLLPEHPHPALFGRRYGRIDGELDSFVQILDDLGRRLSAHLSVNQKVNVKVVALAGKALPGHVKSIGGTWSTITDSGEATYLNMIHLTGYDGTAAYMAAKGMPMVGVLLPLTILTELAGGILLVIGYKARWAALALAGFTILATLIFHNFWAVEAAQKMAQQTSFMKNVAIIGGLLVVFAFGSGRYGVEKS
jgi:putative oxidoreductase